MLDCTQYDVLCVLGGLCVVRCPFYLLYSTFTFILFYLFYFTLFSIFLLLILGPLVCLCCLILSGKFVVSIVPVCRLLRARLLTYSC